MRIYHGVVINARNINNDKQTLADNTFQLLQPLPHLESDTEILSISSQQTQIENVKGLMNSLSVEVNSKNKRVSTTPAAKNGQCSSSYNLRHKRVKPPFQPSPVSGKKARGVSKKHCSQNDISSYKQHNHSSNNFRSKMNKHHASNNKQVDKTLSQSDPSSNENGYMDYYSQQKVQANIQFEQQGDYANLVARRTEQN
jgi:hypothetical protein